MHPNNPLWHAKHIFRVGLILFLGLVGVGLGRSFFIPKSWGQGPNGGHYRADNLQEQRDKPVRHGGDESCKECHEDEYAAKAADSHAKVRCEVCHAPVVTHALLRDPDAPPPEDPKADREERKTKDMVTDRTNSLCLRCHGKLLARPKTMPQVEGKKHVEENDGVWKKEACIECHEAPHEPAS